MIYIENPNKTSNPMVVGNPNMNKSQYQALSDVIEYAGNTEKTKLLEEKQCFVTGVNCQADSARAEMIAAKEMYGKNDGICAYHGYQSFKPGEVTPAVAHEIGLKLAEQMWGGRFQVLVATHLDHDHIHNHFVVNSVSFTDGGRLWQDKNYWKMRNVSDDICAEYGLSIITNPQRGKHYAEWRAEKKGKPTWRSVVKKDIDRMIRQVVSVPDLFELMQKNGYEIKEDRKYISVRPPGAERFMRLRSLGETYDEDELRRRILIAKSERQRGLLQPVEKSVRRISGNLPKRKRKGIQALYYKWLYFLGVLPKHKPRPVRNDSSFYLELKRLDEYIAQFDYIRHKRFKTVEAVVDRRLQATDELAVLIKQRDELRKEARSANDMKAEVPLQKIHDINLLLKKIKAEIKLCSSIEEKQRLIDGKLQNKGILPVSEIKTRERNKDYERRNDYTAEH